MKRENKGIVEVGGEQFLDMFHNTLFDDSICRKYWVPIYISQGVKSRPSEARQKILLNNLN